MDYSSIAHDPADPVESSPWGSPRADRDTFGAAGHGADVVPSPLPPHQLPYDDNHDSEHDAGNAHAAEPHDPLSPPRSVPSNEHEYAQQQAAPQQQKRTEAPARYQTGARQNARQAAPTYRLQGKITALERTGKKDPILRFDVYVCYYNTSWRYKLIAIRPISLSSAPRNTETFVAHTPNSSNSLNI
jgi:hypothetical protein